MVLISKTYQLINSHSIHFKQKNDILFTDQELHEFSEVKSRLYVVSCRTATEFQINLKLQQSSR